MSLNEAQPRDAMGGDGCKCADRSSVLASLDRRRCRLPEGGSGVLLAVEGPCVPHSYGSTCLAHDLIHVPACDGDWCRSTRPWCYVDARECMLSSAERVYRSEHFHRDEGFYSYTTCDSSFDDYSTIEQNHVLGGITITATSPTSYIPPYIYKRDPSTGEILSAAGDEYFNNSVPYEGFLVHYLEQLQDIADGDFTVSYTYGSKASKQVHPTSAFNAAVQDIGDGLVDMAVSGFWVTGQRLKIASFSEPLYYGRVMLVIKNPGIKDDLGEQVKKVMEPFNKTAWVLITAIIAAAAILSVWFSELKVMKPHAERGLMTSADQSPKKRRKKTVYARLLLDSCLEKGLFFFNAGIEHESDATLPYKFLMFGFGAFILIVVSCYVANLAAFLTRSSMTVPLETMEEVVESKKKVCASPALRTELQITWPKANFVFSQSNSSDRAILAGFDAKLCDFLAISRTDSLKEFDLMDEFCDRHLVFTESIIYENQVAFPIRAELAAGLSYWMYEGEKYHGITVENSRKKFESFYTKEPKCPLTLRSARRQANEDDYIQISPGNLFLPSVVFLACAVLASILHVYHRKTLANGNSQSMIGRTSTFVSHSTKGTRALKASFSSRLQYQDMWHDNNGSSTLSASSGHQPQRSRKVVKFLEGVEGLRSDLGTEGGVDQDAVHPDKHLEKSPLHSKERTGLSNGNDSSPVESAFKRTGNDCAENAGDGNEELSSDEDDSRSATSRLETLVEGAFDEILACVQEIKRKKKGKGL